MMTFKIMAKTLCGAALLTSSTLAPAAAIDGSVPLLCAVTDTVSCDAGGGCVEGSAKSVNLPIFITVDVESKTAQSSRASGEQRTSAILSVHNDGASLVLLGVDQGAGWSVAIGKDTGRMTLAVSGDGIGYLALGACTPK